MKNNTKFSELRQRAEDLLDKDSLDLDQYTKEDFQQLLHELRVHRIELQLQNQELRETQQELLEARDKFADLYDFAPVGYFTINDKGLIQAVNLTGSTLLAAERSSMIHTPMTRYITSATQDVFYLHHKQLFNTQHSQICEIKLCKENGDEIHAKLESAPIIEDDGTVKEYRMIVSDITQTKETEEKLKQVHEELENRVQERTAALAQANADLQAEIQERTQIEKMLRQRNQELSLVTRSVRAFISSLDLQETLATISEAVRYLLQVSHCRIWLINSKKQTLVCQTVNNQGDSKTFSPQLKVGEGLAGWIAKYKESLIINDIRKSSYTFRIIEPEFDTQICSMLGIPLNIKQEPIGILQVMDEKPNRFSKEDLDLLEPLAATAAMAVENARLYKQAQQDAETQSILLREINHRVKNNLSAILGLLYTRRKNFNFKNPADYQKLINELTSQIRGLATVHNLLSASKWQPLSLSKLTQQIIRSALAIQTASQRVEARVDHSPIEITPEQAHNLALILNELTTNTLKHSSSEEESSPIQIMVRLFQEEDNIRLEFQDNGIGYPEEILHLDLKQHNVGFELIKNIVQKNLNGSLTLKNKDGAMTIICFKAKIKDGTTVQNLSSPTHC